jgi:outer membrane protein TolC
MGAILAGCSTPVPPAAEEVTIAVPGLWSALPPETVPAAAQWGILASDPALTELLREAWVNNRDLAVAAANLRAARAQAGLAGADLGPSINAGLEAERSGRWHNTGPQETYTLGSVFNWERKLVQDATWAMFLACNQIERYLRTRTGKS